MKLEELKCKNCGALIEVEENAKKVKCKYCNTTFKVTTEDKNDARKQGYEFEKGRIEAQEEQFKNDMENLGELHNTAKRVLNEISPISKYVKFFFLIFFIFVLGMIIFIVIHVFSSFNSFRSRTEKIMNEHATYENRLEERADYFMP